jgi:hypothetical protein
VKTVIIFLLLVISSSIAFADTVTLEWDPNSEPYLSGYKIHWGPASGTYTNTLDVGNVTTVSVDNITIGTVFAATAYASDKPAYMDYCMSDPHMIETYPDETARSAKCSEDFGTGIESGYSNEVVYQGGGVLVMLPTEDLMVFRPGARIVDGLEILYEFKGLGSVIADTALEVNAVDLSVESGVVDRITGGGVQIVDSAIIKSQLPLLQILDSASFVDSISIEIWASPLFTTQIGPARIVTYSKDTSERNFTVGQQNDQYILRLRRVGSDLQGWPELKSPIGTLTDKLTHVVFTYSDGSAKCYIDGAEVASADWTGAFDNWDSSLYLALGNEMTGDRAWLGALYLVAIYSKALSVNEIAVNYQAGF